MVPSSDHLTSVKAGGFEQLHALVAGQQMWAWPRGVLRCGPVDGDGTEALHKEASGVAGHQDAFFKLAEQTLAGISWVRLGKHHLLYAALRL